MGKKSNIFKKIVFLNLVKKGIPSDFNIKILKNFIVAVSGGSDSVGVFYALLKLFRDNNIRLNIAHVNHGLRGRFSKRDAIFVKCLAKKENVGFYSVSARVSKVRKKIKFSIEEIARKIRYSFFKKLIVYRQFSRVFLGHHKDDNAESFLMFLLRGSGMPGLSSMLQRKMYYYIRPFIFIRKEQIVCFLISEKIKYLEDETNNNFNFLRNKMRNYLIPKLSELFNPNIVEVLSRVSELFFQENDFIENLAKKVYNEIGIKIKKNSVFFPILKFNALHLALKRRLLRKGILFLIGSLRGINFIHLDLIVRMVGVENGIKIVCLPRNLDVIKHTFYLEIKKLD